MIGKLKRCEINVLRGELRGWYNRPLGRMLLDMERAQVEAVLPNLFGYHILQIGCLLGDDLLACSRIPHRVLLDPDCNNETLKPGAYVYPDSLPIATDSVDVVLLPHTLEYERDPHRILREVDRVLIPEGHVVVLGFNPWSLWGAWSLLNFRRRRAPWCGSFLSLSRINDWMGLLGFDVVEVQTFFFRPPLQHSGLMARLGFIERLGARYWPRLSGGYVLVAKKQVSTMTPIRPRWRPRRGLVGGLASPSTTNRTTRSVQSK